jgi:1-pyrroline-5-carboxylate dehydrogenase
LLYKILEEAGLPPGVINFVPSAPADFGAALQDPNLGGLHFTGSTATFNTLWRNIGSNLENYKSYPRLVGETGGKNFHIVHPSADLDNAVLNTVRSAFEFQGQKCSACSRLYVAKSIWAQFQARLLQCVADIKLGQPDDFSVFMTAVIDRTAYNKHVAFIEHARGDPSCSIIAGGTYDSSLGYFVKPTVILTTDPKCKTMSEEIFGPVLTVYVYNDADFEATLGLVDSTSAYALTGAIFARDRNAILTAEKLLQHSAGNFYINDKCTGAVVGEQPFGGARLSGTNDKAGSHLNLLRWVSPRTIKENSSLLTTFTYPHMAQ